MFSVPADKTADIFYLEQFNFLIIYEIKEKNSFHICCLEKTVSKIATEILCELQKQ